MLYREDGSVLVLSMLVMVVLLTFGMALSAGVNNEVRVSSMEESRVKAFYLAEGGMEKALYDLENNQLPTTGSTGDGSYEITITDSTGTVVTALSSLTTGTYTVTSTGKVNGREKTISEEVDITVSGGNGDGSIFAPTNLLDTEDSSIVASDYSISNVDVSAQYYDDIPNAKFDNSYLSSWADPGKYFGSNTDITSDVGSGKYFVQGNLHIKNNITATSDNPAIIFAAGHLYIQEYVKLENVYILTSDSSHIDAPIYARDTLIYSSNGNTEITDEMDNSKAFDFQGAIINDSGWVKFALNNASSANFDKGTIHYGMIPDHIFMDAGKTLEKFMEEKSSEGNNPGNPTIDIDPKYDSWKELK